MNIEWFFSFLEVVRHETDEWEEETYTRQVNVIGAFRRFLIHGFEEAVSWPSSNVKHWEEAAAAGDAVTLTIVDGNMHSLSVPVKIIGVDWDLNLSVHTEDPVRDYVLELQEE